MSEALLHKEFEISIGIILKNYVKTMWVIIHSLFLVIERFPSETKRV